MAPFYTFPPSGNAALDAHRKAWYPSEGTPQLMNWVPVVSGLAPAQIIPVPFAMAWNAVESGGNPCAIGTPGAKGPDGEPQELGIWQLYNPDDLKALGATGAELRAYCVPNTQRQSRPMTDAEMLRHAQLGIDKIKKSRIAAEHFLGVSKINWLAAGPTAPDYWSAVKLVHALPSIMNPGFAQVTAKLGRAPSSWHEFRATYEKINPRAVFDPAKDAAGQDQDGYFRALDNAEWTGFHVQPFTVA